MKQHNPSRPLGRIPAGKTLVMFALLLPVLLGMVGLVLDCGLLMAAQREAQNAADAAAMAAAMAKLSNQGDPRTVATTFVTQYNGLSNATLTTFNNPPAAGPHTSSDRYYEVVVSYPVTTLFMPALGAPQSQSVQARAVAGFEAVPAGEALGILDPTAASPGLTVTDGARLAVNGRININSTARPAATADGGGWVEAAVYRIVGPAVSGTFNLTSGSSGQLALSQPPLPDPLINLPTPATTASTANNTAPPPGPAWSTQALGSPSVVGPGNANGLQSPNSIDPTDGTVQLYPGVYQSITITGGKVNFNPGVYILSPASGTPSALTVTGGAADVVTGNGVMFYNTGGDFVPSTGYPDYNDARLYDPGPSGINAPPSNPNPASFFGGIQLDSSNGNQISLSPSPLSNDPYKGILIYQRRANRQSLTIAGGTLPLDGTLYAKWAPLTISGGGSYQAQFIVGSMQLSGPDTLSLRSGNSFGRANQVFLVE